MTAESTPERSYLDDVLEDAEGHVDLSGALSESPEQWRDGLCALLEEVRADITATNVDITRWKQNPNRTPERRKELNKLNEERAAFVERQRVLDTRLRMAKSLCGPRRLPDKGRTALEQALEFQRAALAMLQQHRDELAAEANETNSGEGP